MKNCWPLVVAIACVLATPVPIAAQEFRGRINGIVTDQSGSVLPGVTVTATSPALIQAQTALTGADGLYRLIALPAGVYSLNFELAGFQPVKHTDIRVVINTTLTVDTTMRVAAVEESVTVTGTTPGRDTTTTGASKDYTKELRHE